MGRTDFHFAFIGAGEVSGKACSGDGGMASVLRQA
jgi:hypothetical protein